MNIIISTRHTSIPQQTKEYAEQKAEKLGKYYKLGKLEVILDKEAENYCAEFVVSPAKGGTKIVGTAEGAADWFAAIDQASDKVERQVRKVKEKVKSHRVRKHPAEATEVEPEENENE